MFSIMKQWKTLNGEYHSTTVDKADYDSAFGEIHSMVKPMMNDTNVKSFRLVLFNDVGATMGGPIVWDRPVPAEEMPESEE